MKRTFLFVLLLAWGAIAASAQTTGMITGRVVDGGTQLAMGGVQVRVEGTALETYTNSDGRYTLPRVPTGPQAVSFRYVGYESFTRSVEVTEATRLDAQFGDEAIQMDAFVIEGAMVGTARAINQQRAANTLTNIVASDEIGSFADQNAAEALQRVPGVSLYRDQGEGRYVVLRGLNFNYTAVDVNGGSFAGADLGDRATALDVVPTDALASVEVTKVPTPDMDGEGLGGRINIKTKSPLDYEGVAGSLRAQGQYSALTGEWTPKVNGFFSTRFGDDNQFGLLIAPTWQTREFGSHNFETGGDWTDEESPQDGNDYYFIEEIQFRDYIIERERYGVNLAFEAQPTTEQHLYLHAGYNRFTDTEDRHRTNIVFKDGDIDYLVGNQATVTSAEDDGDYERMFERQLRMREKDQEVFSIVAGIEQRIDLWEIKGRIGYTKGEENRPNELVAKYEAGKSAPKTIGYDHRSPYDVAIIQTAGQDVTAASTYGFDELEVANETGT
jgi:TonB-dependent receptor